MYENHSKLPTLEHLFEIMNGSAHSVKSTKAPSRVTQAINDTHKHSKGALTFNIKPMCNASHIMISHTLKYVGPKPGDNILHKDTTNTPVYIGMRGKQRLTPGTQQAFFIERMSG
ncbi:MAG TPA: hypothetical protein ACQGQH_08790 [Xylella sp.]